MICKLYVRLVVLFCFTCLSVVSHAATDVFLAAAGSDQNDGSSQSQAVCSISRAQAIADEQLKTGDCVLHVGAGEFKSDPWRISAGSNQLSIVGMRGSPGSARTASTVIHGPIIAAGRSIHFANLIIATPANPPDAKPADSLLEVTDSPSVSLSGCLLTGNADTAVRIQRCAQWTIESCVFYDIYRDLYVVDSSNGRIVNNTVVDDRLGHGTNSLTSGRIELRGSQTNHIVLFNNALSPRDPDGKILLLDGCGDDFQSDYNIWRGVITHQYGTEQDSNWQNSFRTLDAWQAHTKKLWGVARDVHSLSEPLTYKLDSAGVPRLIPSAVDEEAGAGKGTVSLGPVQVPPSDFFGLAMGHDIGAIALRGVSLESASTQSTTAGFPQGARSFTVEFPIAGRASVGIFLPDGRQIRTIVSAQLFDAGKHTFVWDGRDNADVPLVKADTERLTYRAVISPDHELALDIAGAGLTLPSHSTASGLADQPQEKGEGMWCDAQQNLYRVSSYDEAGTTILSITDNGQYRWRNWKHNGNLVAGDEKYIYVIGCDRHESKSPVVERYPLAGTEPVSWPDGKPFLTLAQPDAIVPTGIAIGNGNMFISDGPHNRVLVYTLGADQPQKQITVLRPAGLLFRADGSLVICSSRSGNEQGKVSVCSSDGTVIATHPFDDPVDVTTGPDDTVFVADGGEGMVQQVVQCRLLPSYTEILRIGSPGGYDANPDPVVRPDRLMRINHLASSGSSLWIGQKEPGYARNRLVRYDLAPGKAPQLGMEILSLEGQNGSTADPHDASQIFSAALFGYQVDLNNGHWDWTRNYQAARVATVKEQEGCSTAAVFYIGGQRFLATTICDTPTTTSRTVVIYRFDGNQLVPCGAVGGKFFGTSFEDKQFDPKKSGQWTWIDSNQDGVMQAEEVKQMRPGFGKDAMPYADCTWGCYIERDGTIVWPGEQMHYLRPTGLDPTGKMPVYDWSKAVSVKYLNFPDRDELFEGRVDTDGTIFDLSTTKHDRMPPGYWGMGTVLSGLNAQGHRQFSVPLNLTAKGLAVDERYVYVCSCFGPYFNQYTKDGLLVRTFSCGHIGSQFGWFDFTMPINSVTDPKTGDSILTAEEQWFGRVLVLRVPDNVQRLTGDIPVP